MKISHQSILGIFVLYLFCFQSVYSRKEKKKRDPIPPKWKLGSRTETGNNIESITEGDDIFLSCSATGRPKPDITWYKNKEVIDITYDNRMKKKKHTFQISNAKHSDEGNYTCSVENEYGSLKFTYIVDVIVRIWPLEITGPQNVTVQEGETAQFFCRALNDPDAQIKWLKRQTNMSSTGSSVDRPTSSFVESQVNPEVLVIENVTLDDAGTYTCLVGNYHGLQYHEAWLTVIPLPQTTTTTTTTTTIAATTTSTTIAPVTVAMETTEKLEMNTTEKTRKHGGRGRGKDRNRERDRGKDRNKERKRERERERELGRQQERERNKNKNKLNNNRNHKNNLHFDESTPFVMYEYPEIKRNNLPEYDNVVPDASNDPDDGSNVTAAGSSGPNEDKISVWTIYIVVGAVAGGILIIGLVSILVAICCQKEEGSEYKSTSV